MATVVTAFYPLGKSKHGTGKYHLWLQNLCAIPCNLVVFTDATTAPLIREARGDRPTVIHERPFDAWDMTTPAMMEMWRRQMDRDPERAIHSPELYAVWAIKQEAVMSVIAENPFQSRWFIWCDIGIQRHAHLQPWYMTFPTVDACERLIAQGRMTFLEVRPIPQGIVDHWARAVKYTGPAPSITLGGGCIAGDAAAWSDFSQAYKEELSRFDAAGHFNGKDQIVFFMMLINRRVKQPYRLIHAQPFGSGGDPWMCMPVIFGGKVRPLIDKRFEPV
jgi:hypothetical protein